MPEIKIEHMCGLSGFMVGLDGQHDICPSCEFFHWKSKGDSDEIAKLKVEKAKILEWSYRDKKTEEFYAKRLEAINSKIGVKND